MCEATGYSADVCCAVCTRRDSDHFSCSRAGMLMFQPIAWRSKPHVNRLHDWFSSFHVVQHTIRLWPCMRTHTQVLVHGNWCRANNRLPVRVILLLPFCCCVEVWPASPHSCQTGVLVDCRVAEQWSSGWQTRWSWKIRCSRTLNWSQSLSADLSSPDWLDRLYVSDLLKE